MSRLVEFEQITIDFYEQTDIMGTGDASASYYNMPGGGSIDNYGNMPTYAGSIDRSKSAIVAGSTENITEITLNKLKALRGKKSKLWRLDAEGERQYTYARLISVQVVRTTNEARHLINAIQSVSIAFICDSDTWLGEFNGIWQLNSGYKINDELQLNGGDTIPLVTSPQIETINIVQDGLLSKKPIFGVRITVTAPIGSSFSSISIANSQGASVSFSATVNAGKSLIIDAETNTVTNDGVDAYDDLTVVLNSNYPYSWFPLVIGENEITITHDGADTITFDYTEEHI